MVFELDVLLTWNLVQGGKGWCMAGGQAGWAFKAVCCRSTWAKSSLKAPSGTFFVHKEILRCCALVCCFVRDGMFVVTQPFVGIASS